MLGASCNMRDIIKIQKNKIPILEDNCEAVGSKYGSRFLGTFRRYRCYEF